MADTRHVGRVLDLPYLVTFVSIVNLSLGSDEPFFFILSQLNTKKMKTYFKTLKKCNFGKNESKDSGYPGLSYQTSTFTLEEKTKFACEPKHGCDLTLKLHDKHSGAFLGEISKQELVDCILQGQIIQTGICRKGGEHDPELVSYVSGWGHLLDKTICKKCKEIL